MASSMERVCICGYDIPRLWMGLKTQTAIRAEGMFDHHDDDASTLDLIDRGGGLLNHATQQLEEVQSWWHSLTVVKQ